MFNASLLNKRGTFIYLLTHSPLLDPYFSMMVYIYNLITKKVCFSEKNQNHKTICILYSFKNLVCVLYQNTNAVVAFLHQVARWASTQWRFSLMLICCQTFTSLISVTLVVCMLTNSTQWHGSKTHAFQCSQVLGFDCCMECITYSLSSFLAHTLRDSSYQ